MSTRSSARIFFPPLDNFELTIRRRSRSDPTLLKNSEMAAEGNGDLPVHDLRTMEELYQPSLNGRCGPIAPIAIQATNFGMKNDMIQQVQNSCQFHGLSGDDANKHLDKFLHVTQSIKVNGVTDDALRLYLFPYSLTHHATAWFDHLPRNSINTFEQMAKMFLGKHFPPAMVTKLINEITNFRQRPDESLFEAWERYNLSIDRCLNHNMLPVNQQVKAVAPNYETCGGPHSFNVCPATIGNTQNVYAAGAYQGSRTLPCNTITNPKEDLKGITTRSGTAYQGPTIPTTSSSLVVEHETEATKDTMHPTNNGSTKDLQPPVVPTESLFLNSEPDNSPIIEPVASPISAPRPNQRPLIPFADALILIPKFGPSIKCLLTNKDKLCELARTLLNEHYSAVLLKKFLKKQKDPELADRSISCPVRVAKDVFVKVGTFHFLADFVVVDFDADPRVPLILKKSFLNTGRALIDVFEANYNDMTANRIDIIDMACEEYSQEFLGFSDVIASGNPTPYYDPIVSTTSLTLTLFGNSNFLLEEVDEFLALEDDPTLPKVDQSYVNTEGDILLLEAFMNDDPSLPPPNQENYLPEVYKELKIYEAKFDKSSIDEPPEVELKDLPPHLEYAFLKGDDKLPVINAKYLSVEEKTALITVLKSHKRAIAWKLSDIKGVDPEFYTHKILMEKDFEPVVQHQRRVNPKIYDVIK
uniref:Reverse transcriptase domain-containing protein n=1 Tax=Tanacetum cinerariifolium TaxID=118510 RepID=A0A6L2JV02_TANCI|nr:reverse transcriptase domain-containing protein [Tanacetum cinerariifolium]